MDKATMRQVGVNAQSVMQEASDMLSSLEAIRGPDYATLTRMMLMSLTVGNTMRLALHGREDKAAELLAQAFSNQIASLLACAAELAGVPNEVLDEAFHEAKTMDATVTALMSRAVSSAVDGKGFG